MTLPIYNEEHLQWLRGKIVEIARSILSGEVGIVAGARKFCGASQYLEVDRDPDLLFFTGVDSEADSFFITGEARQRWNPEALRAKDAELADYEARVRER